MEVGSSWAARSCQHFFDEVAVDVGEAEVAALEAVGEALEVEDEGGAGLIDVEADFFEVVIEIFAGAAVAVPVGVIELDEADAALDQPAGEEAVDGERRLAGLDAVGIERGLGFLREVHQL